jgi:prepilin-type N-terminal cleavage/methylation domain-containing protein
MNTVNHRDRWRCAFTLIELLLVVAIVALLVAILLPGLKEARRSGRAAVCLSNLRQHAIGTQSYAGDYQDQIWTFSWGIGEHPESLFGAAGTPVQAASDQAITILKRRTDRADLVRASGWMPSVMYSQVVLLDYLDQPVTSAMSACPEDRKRLQTRADIPGYLAGAYSPSSGQKYWPYSSSYNLTGGAFDRMQSRDIQAPSTRRLAELSQLGQFSVGQNSDLCPSRLTDVAFPGHKVHTFEMLQRHSGTGPFVYALQESISASLRFDGSAAMQRGMDLNPGWQPRSPSQAAGVVAYIPPAWEGKTRTGHQDLVHVRQRWTRGGLRGVDFGGREVETGQGQ